MPTATVPNTFSNIPAATNPIDATQVNANFTALVAAINGQIGSDNLNAALAASIVKPGVIQMTGASTADTGFLLCDGAAVSRATYATLFARISTAHGVGDGSTTFNLPDMRGRSPLGVGTAAGAAGATAHTLGQKSGEETHVLSTGEMPAHTHPHNYGSTAGGSGGAALSSTADFGNGNMMSATGGGSAHNIMHPYTGVNFQIKT